MTDVLAQRLSSLILIHLFLLWLLYHCLVVFYSSRLKFTVADFRVQSETIFCRKISFKIFSYILSCMKIFCTVYEKHCTNILGMKIFWITVGHNSSNQTKYGENVHEGPPTTETGGPTQATAFNQSFDEGSNDATVSTCNTGQQPINTHKCVIVAQS